MTLGVGLLGLGKHGLRYARHLAQGDIPGAHLAAVWRRDALQGKAVAAELGTRYHPTVAALLEDPAVEVVFAAIPSGLHRDVSAQVAAAGHPLLLEKPLATTVTAGEAIIAAFKEAHVPLGVAQTLRFDPLIPSMVAALKPLGAVKGFGFEQRLEPRGLPWEDDPQAAGGGVLFQTAIHTVDALRVVTGGQLRVLAATVDRVHYRRLEDHALLHLEATGGPHLDPGRALGDIRVSKIGGSRHHHFALYADGGGVEADFIDRTLTVTIGRTRERHSVPEIPTVVASAAAFIEALLRGAPPPVTGADALENVRVLEAALQRSGGNNETAPASTA